MEPTIFIKTDDGELVKLKVVNRIDFTFPNAVVIYESIGEDGGYTIHTGRLNSSLSMNALLIAENLQKGLKQLSKLKSIKSPVMVGGKTFDGSIFGKFLIESINGSIEEGSEALRITLSLKEYRQANVKRTKINLIYSGEPIYEFLKHFNYILQ